MAKSKKNFYAVRRGWKTGIFTDYDETRFARYGQEGHGKPEHRGFETYGQAQRWMNAGGQQPAPTRKFYAVREPRSNKIFTDWKQAQSHMGSYSHPIHQSFPTREEAQTYLETGEVENPTGYFGVAIGHIPGVYSSWARAKEQLRNLWPNDCSSRLDSVEDAKRYVANALGISRSEVQAFIPTKSLFDQFRTIKPTEENATFSNKLRALASDKNLKDGSKEQKALANRAVKEEFEGFLTQLSGVEKKEDEKFSDIQSRKIAWYSALCKLLKKGQPRDIPHAVHILKKGPWVNIIDLIDFFHTGKVFHMESDFAKFATYTLGDGKRIGLGCAKESEFVSALLVDFRNPERQQTTANRAHGPSERKRSGPPKARVVLSGAITKSYRPAEDNMVKKIKVEPKESYLLRQLR